MDKTTEGADLSGPETAQAATQDMGGAMSVGQFADLLVKKAQASREPEKEAEKTDEAAEGTAEDLATPETEAQPEATAEGEETEGAEQPEEQPEAAEDDVLSKPKSNEPDKIAKWQEKTNKRFAELTAKAKTAEERAQQLEQELAALKSQPPVEEKAPEAIPVAVSDPGDRTSTVLDETELAKIEQEARDALEVIEANQPAILRALSKDEATVKIDGQEYPVEFLQQKQREAKKHLERFIPERKRFLAVHKQSVATAKQLMPQLFDKRSSEYQEFQQLRRVLPALSQIPMAEQWYALTKIGLESLKKQQEKPKEAVKTAAATPPKAAADTTAAAAQAKPRSGPAGEKAKLKAQLERAEKEFASTGSKETHARTLELKARLKRIS